MDNFVAIKRGTHFDTYYLSALFAQKSLTANSLVQFCSRTWGDKVSAVWIALAVESTSPVELGRGCQELLYSQGLTIKDPARL